MNKLLPFEMSVTFYQSTRCHVPGDVSLHQHRWQNLSASSHKSSSGGGFLLHAAEWLTQTADRNVKFCELNRRYQFTVHQEDAECRTRF